MLFDSDTCIFGRMLVDIRFSFFSSTHSEQKEGYIQLTVDSNRSSSQTITADISK